jgi:hypothetical protein
MPWVSEIMKVLPDSAQVALDPVKESSYLQVLAPGLDAMSYSDSITTVAKSVSTGTDECCKGRCFECSCIS